MKTEISWCEVNNLIQGEGAEADPRLLGDAVWRQS